MDLLIPFASQGWYSIYYHLGSYYKCISNISKPSPTATASLGTCSRAGHFCPSILITTQDPHRRTKSWSKNVKESNTTSHVIWSSAGNMLSLNAREASRNPKKSALLNDTSHPRICRPATKIGVQTLQNATWILAINRSVSPIILGNMSNHPQIEDFNWLPGRFLKNT